ncbi:MAG: hypothetical protein C0621_07615 [Desulfuromonas sp.]|mgnify:CR=1 FL=1|nr:MAG: hypothetical protein C0621_07615 [Desulfuromonas sp.]
MNRFRFTLLAICLVLFYLGKSDIELFWNNRTPLSVDVANLHGTPPQDWLTVTGGALDMEQAISTSGSLDLDALLVPLRVSGSTAPFTVLVETRAPDLLQLFTDYYFKQTTIEEQRAYLDAHYEAFHPQVEITGMVVSGLIASGNRDKLATVAKETGLNVSEQVIFLSEGQTPPTWRGFFFVAMALLGMVKFVQMGRKKEENPPQGEIEEAEFKEEM